MVAVNSRLLHQSHLDFEKNRSQLLNYNYMQKRRLVLILISFVVLFSLFQLYSFVHKHSSKIQSTSLSRFKYLMLVHALFIITILLLMYFDQFYQNTIVVFVSTLFVSFVLLVCEQHIKRIPGHKEDDDYLIFRDNKFKQSQEKTFLSIYYLIYMYSILTAILTGLFLLIRFLVICYYQRQLHRQLQTAVTTINYSDQLKGKECAICISEFMENIGENLYQINSCQHIFHVSCIKEWVNYSKTCPICRAKIFPNRRSNHQLIF